MNTHEFEQAIVGSIPLVETVAFMQRIKTASVRQPQVKTAETLAEEPATSEMNDPYYRQMAGNQLLQSRQRNLMGAMGGAAAGSLGGTALGAQFLGKALGPVAGPVAGSVTGALLGSAPGLVRAYNRQQAYEDLNNPEMKMASVRLRTALAKLAADGGFSWEEMSKHTGTPAPAAPAASLRTSTIAGKSAVPSLRTKTMPGTQAFKFTSLLKKAMAAMNKVAFNGDPNEWMANEQMMQQAQEQSEADYFRQQAQQTASQLQQAQQESQGLQQQMQSTQQQVQEMQQQLDQSGQLQRQVLDQARQVEQAAAQSAAAAHQAATASTLQSMQSSQEVFRHKMMTADMQQAQQGWKDQLMQIAQTDPTAGAGEQIGMPSAGPIPPPAPGMLPGDVGMQGTQPQQAEAPEQGGDGMAPQEGPAGQAEQPPGPANQPPPEGGGAQPQAATEQPTPEASLKPATKQAAVWDRFRKISMLQREMAKAASPFCSAQ